ncbi:MAG: AmpG family muropeptide MFS transporter [Pseudomonadales bacterium]|nr:AmpG family muropeptide MFS transporter [Pseudomonadales bacterium]
MNSNANAKSPSLKQQLLTRRMLICIFTGFSSGLPLYVIYQLMPLWLRDQGVGLAEIGFFALVGVPYTWKFIWSPLMDRFSLPMLGHRRGWMLLTQILLLLAIASIGFLDPEKSIWTIAYLAAGIAFFSASQDIVLDAYRRELLDESQLGTGNTLHIQAYRIAGLVPGALATILSDIIPWSWVFVIVAGFMLVGVTLTLSVKELTRPQGSPRTIREAAIDPFKEFISRRGLSSALTVLAFMLLYKLGDSMATALSYPFYYDLGFSKSEIGIIAKTAALWSAIAGGFIAIPIMARLGINKCLWLFGVVQIVSILGFWVLAQSGPDKTLLAVVISFEYLGVGLGTAGFTAYIARETSIQFAATQFALLTAITALPRTFANALTGVIVDRVGWEQFFLLCTVLAIPGMLLLIKVAPWNGLNQKDSS